MKILVTGGCGFIGSNLVDRLVKDGHKVGVIDDLSAICHDQFYYNDNATYYKNDISDYENTRVLYDDVDFVFHLAAESRIQPALENPLQTVKTNTLGTATVLQCSREAGVKRVMYSSTSSAYGTNTPPLYEEMDDDCLNPYSVAKVAGEKLCKMYNDLFSLQTVVFRYFNVYGPREPVKGPYAPVVGLFLRQKRAGELLTIVGDGGQKRDFTHVDDVVQANINAMNLLSTHYGYSWGTPINIGTGKNYSVLELARLISGEVKFIPQRPGEARETLADASKAEYVLGWTAKKKITDYIEEQLKL
ncbi:WcaG Nucleoside-diphosphate-sugar epimerases [uncultured Caudovirales phage]|uniref:WcaG Nucleoside-diphosphate-sugar epimerases n=1 Tax=uncultured Caudovirales phage TaxID=2100421 RepID=A0A6J5LFM6_9CAUD|nr:WcaG Nucleoside-diphosphate-sugar epimerases [uncultured Caudovirales phage]